MLHEKTRVWTIAILSAGLSWSNSGWAQEEDLESHEATSHGSKLTGFELGLRTGYGIPFGKGADTTNGDMNKVIAGQIPIWLEAGYRVIPQLQVGAYFSYGFGLKPSDYADRCERLGADCSLHSMRLGAGVQYHFAPGRVDPWLGGGIGYEWLGSSVSVGGTSGSSTAKGFEFFNVGAGVDFPVAPGLGIGPFAELTLAQYDSISCSGAVTCSNDFNKSLHEWLFLGVRGTFVIAN